MEMPVYVDSNAYYRGITGIRNGRRRHQKELRKASLCSSRHRKLTTYILHELLSQVIVTCYILLLEHVQTYSSVCCCLMAAYGVEGDGRKMILIIILLFIIAVR